MSTMPPRQRDRSSMSSSAPSGRRRHRPKSSSSAQRWTREGGRLCRVKPAEPMPPTAEPLPPIALLRDSGLVLHGAPRREAAATRTPSLLLGTCIDMTNEDPDAIKAWRSAHSFHELYNDTYYEMRSTRLTCRLVCRAWALAVRTGAAWSCAHVWTKSRDRIHPDVAPWIRRLKVNYMRVADDAIPQHVISTCSQFPHLESLDIAASNVCFTCFHALSRLRQLKALNLGYMHYRDFSDDECVAAQRLLPKSLEILYVSCHSLGFELPSLTSLYASTKSRALTRIADFRCPRLVELDLSGSFHSHDDSSLELIVEACPNIRWLDISKCDVGDGISAILSRMTSLRFLGARCLFHVETLRLVCPALEHLVIGGKNSMRRQHLEVLDVSACPCLRIVSARYIGQVQTLQLPTAVVSLDLSHSCIPPDLLASVLGAPGPSLKHVSLICAIQYTAFFVENSESPPELWAILRRLQSEFDVDIMMPNDYRKFALHTSTSGLPPLEVQGLLHQPITRDQYEDRL